MNKIRVNTGSLQRTQTDVEGRIRDIETKLEAMLGGVSRMNAMWSGEANTAFNQAFQDDINALKNLCGQLKKIAQYEGNARKEYDTCEQKVSQLINGINV